MKTKTLRIITIVVFLLMILPSDVLYVPNILTMGQFAAGVFLIKFHLETLIFCICSLGGLALLFTKKFSLNLIGGILTVGYIVHYLIRIPVKLSTISIISIALYLVVLGFLLNKSKQVLNEN